MTTGPTRGFEQHLADHPSSPLFARLADALLNTGEITRALDLCERGLRIYPEYTTGRLVHARCLAARGNLGSAVQSLSGILEEYPENIILGSLIEEWGGLIPEPAVSPVPSTAPDPVPELETTAVPAAMATAVQTGEQVEMSRVGLSVPQEPQGDNVETPGTTVSDDAIMFLGGESSSSPPMRIPNGFLGEDRIISRTLAEIYASQGAIREAVETYRLLLERMPGKHEVYGGRLLELEERLRAHPEGPKRPVE